MSSPLKGQTGFLVIALSLLSVLENQTEVLNPVPSQAHSALTDDGDEDAWDAQVAGDVGCGARQVEGLCEGEPKDDREQLGRECALRVRMIQTAGRLLFVRQ